MRTIALIVALSAYTNAEKTIGESTFKAVNSNATQGDAQKACEQWGGRLATTTAANNAAVRAYATSAGLGRFWIGLNDHTKENRFVWADGKAATYTNWSGGEPNDWGSGEDCTEMYGNGKWNDLRCSHPFPYVCEKSATADANQDFTVEGQMFNVSTNKMTGDEAKKFCATKNAVLAYPNQKQGAAIAKVMHKAGIGAAWIGLNDMGKENHWNWAGAPNQLNKWRSWAKNEPNDWGNGEDCVEMFQSNKWNDLPCNNHKRNPICQSEAPLTCTKSKVWKTMTTYKHYDMTFDIKPTGVTGGWSNVFHVTADNRNHGSHGSRIPAIWFFDKTTRMHVRQGRPGNVNDGCDSCPALAMGKWSKVGLKLEGSTFSVSVNDKVCCTNANYASSDPGRTNVKVYVSDPWHHAAKAQLKDFSYENIDPAIKVEAAHNAALLKSTSRANSLAKQLAKAKADHATAEAGRKAAISDADKKAKAAKAKSDKAAADAKAKAAKEAAAMKAAHDKNMQASLKKQKEEDAAHAAKIAKLAAQKAKLALEKADREAARALKVK